LLSSWVEAGQNPDGFWRQTPRSFAAVLVGAARRRETEQQRLAWAVWHIEALHRSKRLPKLADLTGKRDRPVRRQSWQELEALCRAWAART
jgi:hypothetical protein